jgi:nucleotide-binding universal stress UspA family protein
MPAPLVVGVDDSAHGLAVAQAAARLASALDHTLLLIHAVSDPPTFPYGDPRAREVQRWRSTQKAERMLDRIREALPPVAVRTRVLLGDHRAVLASVAQDEDAALLAVGSSGPGLLAARTRGGAADLAAMTGRPVMVVPLGVPAALGDTGSAGSIVCGLDGSPQSVRALEVARALAAPLGLELVPVFAERERRRPEGVGGVVVEVGSAPRAINRVVARRNGQLIVVGSRGHSLVASALLGSVSGAVAGSARVPVVIVPPGARTDGLIHPSSGAALVGPNDAAEDLRAAA